MDQKKKEGGKEEHYFQVDGKWSMNNFMLGFYSLTYHRNYFLKYFITNILHNA
jgi:hypothetical protein